jgi:secreted PhoX family phosphatase
MTTIDPRPDEGLSRRGMLTRSAAGLGIALSGSVSGLFGTRTSAAVAHGRHGRIGYGPLVDDPAGLLSLPQGFDYRIVAQSGATLLETGEPTPSDPDGTAAFVRRGGDGSVLVNNHENSGSEPYPVPKLAGYVYDDHALATGGTTNIEVDRRGNRIREYVSLAGTSTNCAGGATPWNTWLTCEETEVILGKPHGYVFEVDPYERRANRDPEPIKALGRYAHEACVVDPRENRIYLTEDAGNPNGLLYRWTPPRKALPLRDGSLRRLADDAGTLEAMTAYDRRGQHIADLSPASVPGTKYRIGWVTVPDRDARTLSTRKQLTDDQITRSRKYEGMWWGDGGAYFVCSFARTSDGSAAQHDGQVWFLDPRDDTIALKLHFAYTPQDQDGDPDGPDNITVSAYGGVILAEDGEGVQHLVGSTDRGEAFFFARNDDPENAEFTGPTFSHDRKILFANVQSPGYVYAIRGPFKKT